MPAASAPAPSRAATCPPTAPAPKTVIFIAKPSPPEKSMRPESVRLPRRRQAFLAAFIRTCAAPDTTGRRTPSLTLPRLQRREGWGYRTGFQKAGIILLLIAALIPRPAA